MSSPASKGKKNRKGIAKGLVIFGFVLFVFYLVHLFQNFQYQKKQQQIFATYQREMVRDERIPMRIVLSKLSDTPVSAQVFSHGKWSVSDTEASYLFQSARPGEEGNIIIYGHNKPKIFGSLGKIKKGETISLFTRNGERFVYEVEKVVRVSLSQVEYLKRADFEKLTLYTCAGFLDSQRLVVVAKRSNG